MSFMNINNTKRFLVLGSKKWFQARNFGVNQPPFGILETTERMLEMTIPYRKIKTWLRNTLVALLPLLLTSLRAPYFSSQLAPKMMVSVSFGTRAIASVMCRINPFIFSPP